MVNPILRSVVWLGATGLLAHLKRTPELSVLALRNDVIGWLGVGLFAVGLALHLWSNLTLARSEKGGNTIPAWLVEAGPYRLVRNPIYLAGVCMLLAVPLLYPRWRPVDVAAAGATWLIFHVWVVRREEPGLRERFGPDYADYCRRVPRWLPRVPVA